MNMTVFSELTYICRPTNTLQNAAEMVAYIVKEITLRSYGEKKTYSNPL